MGDVRAAVSTCYRVFARYSFDGGCLEAGDGIGPLEKRLLRMLPPADIPHHLLMAYIGSLPPEISGVAASDLRAVLPRLCELAAEGGVPSDAIADVLHRAGWRTQWPEEEVGALEVVLACLAPDPAEPPGAGAG